MEGRIASCERGRRTMYRHAVVRRHTIPVRKREGARGGWEAVSDQRPQGEGASDRAEMREIGKEDSEGGGLHYRDV